MAHRERLIRWAELVGLVLIWQLICALGLFSPYVLPSPLRVLETFWGMVISGELTADISISLYRVLKGFVIAFVLAFLLGSLRSLAPRSGMHYEHLVQFFRNVPPLSMVPLLILWFGIGELTKTVIIVLAAFFPMYLNIVKGFTGCDRRLLEVGRMFGCSKSRQFLHITLPYASADILVGMRIGLGYAWRAIIGAEMVAAATGLGHMILFAQQLSRTDKVMVGILVIGLVGCATDRLFGLAVTKLWKGTCGEHGWN